MAWIDELLERTLVLVAHPDDECIAFGALLQRIQHPLVVFATNGSPRDPYFWEKYGSREAYAELRRQETMQSMHAAGVKDVLFLSDLPGGDRLVDQELFRNLPAAFNFLSEIAQRRMITALLTLAYEGGHPDHDSCSLLASQLAKRFGIPCWEAPLYHRLADGGGEFQGFVEPSGEEVDVKPTAQEEEAKRAMCLAYTSQGNFLAHFDVTNEKVRPQRAYDYTRPPHEGKTNYEVWQWKMTSGEVCSAFAEFLAAVPKQRAAK
jgi:LmbE family N-acetylglucosaminyl deacetylase